MTGVSVGAGVLGSGASEGGAAIPAAADLGALLTPEESGSSASEPIAVDRAPVLSRSDRRGEADPAKQARLVDVEPAAMSDSRRLSDSDPKDIARALLSDYGFSSDQFGCLDSLWTRESNWNPYADNPTSSAYGIPQALPGSKMASAGSDWATNPATQIKWGLGYIQDRYGSPCGAWGHSQARGWY
ncbi:lytic transglycosylase domain-containing protein [Nocardioides sp. GY 10113]|uniref:lytic transglycosylase domain-containing protein n=1 Tax=Nocardioides sp. GY 10113 TaxID=2569761 RepID=UPI001F0E20B6|nr:lytic transglycosylase domain-containing protein [Nocardioides sp. GY 10113]